MAQQSLHQTTQHGAQHSAALDVGPSNRNESASKANWYVFEAGAGRSDLLGTENATIQLCPLECFPFTAHTQQHAHPMPKI